MCDAPHVDEDAGGEKALEQAVGRDRGERRLKGAPSCNVPAPARRHERRG